MSKFKSRRELSFADKAYKTTRLDYRYTQEKIMDMMEQSGILKVRIEKEGEDFVLEFMAKLRHNEAERMVRMNIPYTPELEDTVRQAQNKKNVLFRVLFYHLKDKFIAINRGLKEFEEEFLADLVIEDNGVMKRLGDVIAPKYKAMLRHSNKAVFKIKAGNEVKK